MGLFKANREDKRGRWSDVFRSLGLVLFFYLFLRWASFEPYVIPSGSMIPTLQVQDYVLVKKWAYGLRVPFTTKWLMGPFTPQRGDIVVFRSVEDDMHFMVKRVVGLPGDKLVVDQDGKIQINGKSFDYSPAEAEPDMNGFVEDNGERSYQVQYEENILEDTHEKEIPPGEIFLMGDNRNHSMDSRFWGSLPVERILGKATLIWLSCGESEKSSGLFCPPEAIRWDRVMKGLNP